MKKSFFKTLLASFGLVFAFSSCLDDGGESSSKADNSFAYISETEMGIKILYASIYNMYSVVPLSTSDFQASDLEPGDCAFVSYKFNNDKWVGTSYINADYINIDEDKIYRKRTQTIAELASFNSETLEEDKEYFRTLSTSYANNSLIVWDTSTLGYRWFISYSYYKKESEQPASLLVSFDSEKQWGENGADLAEGEVVLDFQLEKQGTPGEGEAKATVRSNIINFTYLRPELEKYATIKDKEVKIRFRYYEEVIDPKEGELNYKLKVTANPIVTLSFKDTSIEN